MAKRKGHKPEHSKTVRLGFPPRPGASFTDATDSYQSVPRSASKPLVRSFNSDLQLLSDLVALQKRPDPFFNAPLARSRPRLLLPTPRRVQAARRRFSFNFPTLIKVPHKARICIRREQRKQVLFAFKVAGSRGVGIRKPPRRTVDSSYSCRR